jgi:UDP-N-acetylglucosamine/UDP-N-acetylgalactosamine diphosphorylase
LPLADRWTIVETSRKTEFAPLKNASGADSPDAVRQALSNLAGDWLDRAGVSVPRDADGNVAVAIEVSPLYALNAADLAAKITKTIKVDGPTCLS